MLWFYGEFEDYEKKLFNWMVFRSLLSFSQLQTILEHCDIFKNFSHIQDVIITFGISTLNEPSWIFFLGFTACLLSLLSLLLIQHSLCWVRRIFITWPRFGSAFSRWQKHWFQSQQIEITQRILHFFHWTLSLKRNIFSYPYLVKSFKNMNKTTTKLFFGLTTKRRSNETLRVYHLRYGRCRCSYINNQS